MYLIFMALAALQPVGQEGATDWRRLQSGSWSAVLLAADLERAASQRQAAGAHRDENGDPLPWYVTVRQIGRDVDGAPTVKATGYICGRGHVDNEDGIAPIVPHTMDGAIYDLVCYGQGDTTADAGPSTPAS